jgi:uncharacterized protein with HEPN domain
MNLVERLTRGLLPCGYPPDRKTMTPAHQLELIRRHPGLYRLATEPPALPYEPFALYGFAVGDGWHNIIERLSIELAADPSLVAAQVKEKNGVLKFHVTECVGTEIAAEMKAARAESERTCEICGAPGEIAARLRGWVSVRCVPCESLDDIEEACRRLADYAGSRELASFAADGSAMDASMLALIHLGEGARHQSPERRARFPGIDWRHLDSFRKMTGVTGAPSMTAAEIWAFAKNEAPGLAGALR